MLNSLYKYLVLHRHAGIPGVGSFRIQQTPASITGDRIQPPAHTVLFEPGTALADKQFYQFLAIEAGYSEVDAVRRFQDFAYQLRKDIQQNPYVVLQGLGILKRNTTGGVDFENTASIDKYFASIALAQRSNIIEPAARKEEMHPETTIVEEVVELEEVTIRKDRWWIWAIVLGVIAIGVIAYLASQGNII